MRGLDALFQRKRVQAVKAQEALDELVFAEPRENVVGTLAKALVNDREHALEPFAVEADDGSNEFLRAFAYAVGRGEIGEEPLEPRRAGRVPRQLIALLGLTERRHAASEPFRSSSRRPGTCARRTAGTDRSCALRA